MGGRGKGRGRKEGRKEGLQAVSYEVARYWLQKPGSDLLS